MNVDKTKKYNINPCSIMESIDSCQSCDEYMEQGRELFSHHGVVLKNSQNREDDSPCNGTLSIVQYPNGQCIEWKPADISVSECQDQEWAMVNTVGRRSRSIDAALWRYQPVKVQLPDLKGYRVSRNKSKLMLMKKDGTTYNAFFFQFGNADCFTKALRSFVKTRRSKSDRHFYIVLEDKSESQTLTRSFSELNLFTENPKDAVWKFVNNLKDHPYETTLSTFSKVSEYLLYKNPESRPAEEVAVLLNENLMEPQGTEIRSTEEEDGYHVVGRCPILPPRPQLTRGPPLTIEQWTNAMDSEGRIMNVNQIKNIIFRGGITPSLRYEVWKFLLGYFPWDSTLIERQELRKQKVESYFRMKLQWKSLSEEQESRFADFRERKSLIEKDVNRTDRTVPFFSGDNNPNLLLLYDILMTYVMYNFDLGYVQGMSDLLSPILSLMSNDVDAFWCFVGFMEKVHRNFDMDQSGMKKQLSQLHTLLSAAEPDLSAHLDDHESGNMFFCFRWLLVWFKREFSQNDIMSLWEVLWTGLPCENFHLLICVAILDAEKSVIMENNYGFTEVLKHVNDLSGNMDIDKLLREAEGIFKQLESCQAKLTMSTKRVLGLTPEVSTASSSEDESMEIKPKPSCESVEMNGSDENDYERAISFNFL